MFHQICLMLILPVVFGSTEQLQNSTIKEVASECTHPFINVGGWCLLIDPIIDGHWQAMRDYCLSLGADMVSLYDANVYWAIVKHINSQEWPAKFYWVGGKFSASDGIWTWVDGSVMEMGTPFWGYSSSTEQYPNDSDDNDCTYLRCTEHYYMRDCDCDYYTMHPICHQQ